MIRTVLMSAVLVLTLINSLLAQVKPSSKPPSRPARATTTASAPMRANTMTIPQYDTQQRVVVNLESGVYHCEGSRNFAVYSNKGVFLTQQQALDKGYKPAFGNLCR